MIKYITKTMEIINVSKWNNGWKLLLAKKCNKFGISQKAEMCTNFKW
jgi:hypothetical protein